MLRKSLKFDEAEEISDYEEDSFEKDLTLKIKAEALDEDNDLDMNQDVDMYSKVRPPSVIEEIPEGEESDEEVTESMEVYKSSNV